MTVDAEQFPVAIVNRLVVVIMVLVVNREFAKSLSAKFPATQSTNPGKKLKSPRPISDPAFLCGACK